MNTNNAQWLAERKTGIGGSDCGSIWNENKYKTCYQVWLEKTGQIIAPDISDKLPVWFGKRAEPMILERFEIETGLKVTRNVDNEILKHPDCPFIIGTFDAEGVDPEGNKFIVETKETGDNSAKDWRDGDIPARHILQLYHYLLIGKHYGYKYGYLAVKIGNHDFKAIKITLGELQEALMLQRAKWFWNLVTTMTPPPIEYNNPATTEFIKSKFPMAQNEEIIPTDSQQLDKQVEEYKALHKQIEELKAQKEGIANMFRDFIGDHAGFQTANYKVTNKNRSRDSFDDKKFKEKYPDIYPDFIKTTQYRQIDIR